MTATKRPPLFLRTLPGRRFRRLNLAAVTAAGLGIATALAPVAGSAETFGPKIRVDDQTITQYELDQRALFLKLLNVPGDPEKAARQQLIDEALKAGAGKKFGVKVSDEDVKSGMAEFAGRANMSTDQFVQELKKAGVSEGTFRAFVENGILWRILVRGLYARKVDVTEAEVDRAIARQAEQTTLQVQLSEIFIPTGQNPTEAAALARKISQVTSIPEFAADARQYSAAPTASNGGAVDWMDLSKLPPTLQPVISSMKVGQVTEPLGVQGAIALFQLRGIREVGKPKTSYSKIAYAIYYIDGGNTPEAHAEANRIKNNIDTCDDLYGVAKGQPADVLQRIEQSPSDIPRNIGLELAKLDDNEVSTTLTSDDGKKLMFLMLCDRTPVEAGGKAVDRSQVQTALENQRFSAYADAYLSQLRAEARIVD